MDNFWQSPTAIITNAMKATGNQTGIIARWKSELENWSQTNKNSDAEALQAWLPHFQVRPFYTARELVPMFPALALVVGAAKRLQGQKSSARLRNELIFAKLPRLSRTNGTYLFRHPNSIDSYPYVDEFFIVERLHYWRDYVMTQHEFEEHFK